MEDKKNEMMETIMHRRAIRRFEEKQVDESALQRILQAGLYAPSAGGRQGVIFAVSQDKETNERLGRIKRANSQPRMATATSYVSKEQPSIADDPALKNAFYDAPAVITLFAPKNFLFSAEDCAAGESVLITMQLCSFCWVILARETATRNRSRAKMDAFYVFRRILIILAVPCAFGIRSLVRVFQGKEKCECPGDCSKCRIKCQSNKNYYGIQGSDIKQEG